MQRRNRNSDCKATKGSTIRKWAGKRPWSEVLTGSPAAAALRNTMKILSHGLRGLDSSLWEHQAEVLTLRPSTPRERHLRILPHFRFCLHHRLSNMCVRNAPSVVRRRTCSISIKGIDVLELLGCVKGGDETMKQRNIGEYSTKKKHSAHAGKKSVNVEGMAECNNKNVNFFLNNFKHGKCHWPPTTNQKPLFSADHTGTNYLTLVNHFKGMRRKWRQWRWYGWPSSYYTTWPSWNGTALPFVSRRCT